MFCLFSGCNTVCFYLVDEAKLPTEAKVKLSTDPELEVESMVGLETITLGPGTGALLQFPFAP